MPWESKRGKCSKCKRGPRDIPHLDPTTGDNICRNCYRKIRESESSNKPSEKKVISPKQERPRQPSDLVGREVIDIDSSKVGRIIRADNNGVNVNFGEAITRYDRSSLDYLFLLV